MSENETNETNQDSPKKESRVKVYSIKIRSINSNTNPRQALSPSLDSQGWKVFDGEKSVWPLATSDNAEDRATYVKLIQDFDPDLAAMANTMLTQGQLQPAEVREGGSGKFTLVFGCRRCLAILYNWCTLGKPKEPVVNATLQKGNETQLLQRAIVENIRKQPSLIEEAKTIKMLVNNGQDVAEVAAELGYSVQTINNRLKLLELDHKTQEKIAAGKTTVTKALASLNGTGNGNDDADSDSPTVPIKPKIRSRKEIESAAEEYREGTPQRDVLDWLLGKREKIG